MQTTLKHDANELLLYIGLGASKALLLYPFWLFKSKGTKSTTAFGSFKTPRGWGWHLYLFGFQVYDHKHVAKRPVVGYAAPMDPPSAAPAPTVELPPPAAATD